MANAIEIHITRIEDRMIYTYYWRVKTRYPERFGQFCRVLSRGKMNSCLVEFADGYRTITSRNYVRKHNISLGVK
jgi:hypothetical protein